MIRKAKNMLISQLEIDMLYLGFNLKNVEDMISIHNPVSIEKLPKLVKIQ